MHMHRYLSVLLVIVLFCTASAVSAAAPLPVPKVTLKDHMLGRRTAPVTIITYGDFQCPFCARFSATLKELLRKDRRNLSVVYRHFPLAFHTSAMPAAKASECVATMRGNTAFWRFETAVFAEGADAYERIALSLIDSEKFRSCMANPALVANIQSQADATGDAVNGTPTSFVIDRKTGAVKRLGGAVPMDVIREAIADVQAGLGDPADTVVSP